MAGPLVRVYGAIIFYLENIEKVEAYLRDQERLWDAVKEKETELPETLSVRLREATEHAAPRQSWSRRRCRSEQPLKICC